MHRRVFKWWWGWNPDALEEWLEFQESAGWSLYHVDVSAIRFHFNKTSPRKMRYCVDYQSSIDPEYKAIFEDDGWKLVYYDITGWYIWAKPYEGKRPAIYTNTESLLARNNRLLRVLALMAAGLLALLIPIAVVSVMSGDFRHLIFTSSIYTVNLVILGFAWLKIAEANEIIRERCTK